MLQVVQGSAEAPGSIMVTIAMKEPGSGCTMTCTVQGPACTWIGGLDVAQLGGYEAQQAIYRGYLGPLLSTIQHGVSQHWTPENLVKCNPFIKMN